MTRGGKALAVTAIGVSMSALDTTIVNVARHTIEQDFHASASSVSWVLSGYSIVYAAVLLTSGRLADRYGRKRIYTTGLLVFIGASAACGLAPTLGLLIACRVVQAMGGALLAPAALALVLPEFPMEKKSAAIGVWAAIGSLGAAAGPTLGSLIINAGSWRWAFFINLPIGLAAYVLGRRVLHESRDENATGVPDIIGIVTGVGAVGLLALGISKGNEWGYLSRRGITCFAIAALLVPVFISRCRSARLPVMDLSLLRQRYYAVANLAALLFTLPFYGSVFCNVSFLQQQWNYSVLGAGIGTAPAPIMALITSRAAGRWSDRVGQARVALLGGGLLAATCLIFSVRMTATPTYRSTFLPYNLVAGASFGMLLASLQSGAVKYLPQDRLAMGSAFYNTLRQLGSALAIAIAVAIITRPNHPLLASFRAAWAVFGIAALAVGLLMRFVYRAPIARRSVVATVVVE